MNSSGMGRDVHSLMLSIQYFSMPTTASPGLLGALMDAFGEAVVARDMPEPRQFPSLDSCQICIAVRSLTQANTKHSFCCTIVCLAVVGMSLIYLARLRCTVVHLIVVYLAIVSITIIDLVRIRCTIVHLVIVNLGFVHLARIRRTVTFSVISFILSFWLQAHSPNILSLQKILQYFSFRDKLFCMVPV